MESLRELYKVGNGPSSSHTIGPRKAALQFLEKNNTAQSFKVTLYGSLALTGKGHLTDVALKEELLPATVEIVWKKDEKKDFHTNALEFEVVGEADNDKWLVYSVGGGKIVPDSSKNVETNRIYKQKNMQDFLDSYKETGKVFWELVIDTEGPEIIEYLKSLVDAHPVAVYISIFDHYKHTSSMEDGVIADDIKDAKNLIFCFGKQLPTSKILAVRPRSIGICELENSFSIDFLEVPNEQLHATTVKWIESIVNK